MKKAIKKSICILTVLIFSIATLSFSASADWVYHENVTAESLAAIINDYVKGFNDSHLITPDSVGTAEFDAETNTVRLLKDIYFIDSDDSTIPFVLDIRSLSEDITFDLNGHSIPNGSLCISDDDYNTFTFKDSVGGGKMVAAYVPMSPIEIYENVNLVIESGIYIGLNAAEAIYPDGLVWYLDCATMALYCNNTGSVTLNGGTFIGGNGLSRQDLDEAFVENGAEAILISSETVKEITIADNVVIKGGNGDNSIGGAGIKILGTTFENGIEIIGAEITGGSGNNGGDAIYSDVTVNINITNAALTGGASGGLAINAAEGSNITTTDSSIEDDNKTNTKDDVENTGNINNNNNNNNNDVVTNNNNNNVNGKADTVKIPATGDKTNIIAIFSLALISLATVCVVSKKHTYNSAE